jgi:hypothetical protein
MEQRKHTADGNWNRYDYADNEYRQIGLPNETNDANLPLRI